jgi:tRNA(fMet)-specific endonuclease VapC
MYLLDTDITTLILYGQNDHLNRHFTKRSQTDQLALPIVTRVQIFRGRYDSLLKASDGQAVLIASRRIEETEEWFSQYEIVYVTDDAAKKFAELRANKRLKKIGIPDTLIAAISLAHQATLVTRNTKDFSLIRGIKLENWAVD